MVIVTLPLKEMANFNYHLFSNVNQTEKHRRGRLAV